MKKKIIRSILITLIMLMYGIQMTAFADKTTDPDYAETVTNTEIIEVSTDKKITYYGVACATTPRKHFVKCLTEKKTIRRERDLIEPSDDACIKMINQAADKSGLFEYKVLPYLNTCDELYEYVINNDAFTYTDNYRELKVGDFVFYKECPGVVIRDHTILFADDNNKLVSMSIKSLDNMNAFTVKYPYFEKLADEYMRDNLHYHTAKRCGILANMIAESNINPAAEENTSYRGLGVCQWTGDRQTALIKYAEENGKNLYSLYTQLDFMDFELKNDFSGMNNTLDKYTSPDADGAYSAAFDFCTRYENPLSADSAVDRGIMSEDELWPNYSK